AWTRQRIDLAMYPAVKNWHERIRSRPATGLALLKAQHGDERSDS
ncbi:TPA: thiol:disulfide oxidoreductase, partial [Escherichia coli]